jgi:multiple sugar transport system substrate-binding protein
LHLVARMPRGRPLGRRALLCGSAAAAAACRREPRDGGFVVFKHQPLWGNPEPFRAMLSAFERRAGVRVVSEALPNASDVVHQYYVTALEGAADFDVLVADVVWVAEFARAGWILDLSSAFPPDDVRRDMLPGVAETALPFGRTYAVPWYVDVGVMYRRTDLAPDAPPTYDALAAAVEEARRIRPDILGWLWQGKQYEGLVCNAYEAIWGHGGTSWIDGRLVIDTKEARDALAFLRGTVLQRVSPKTVLSAGEEESRRAFQNGRAVFMRNWPYAFAELGRPGSVVAGKVAVSPLPTSSGAPGAGAIGGWQLAVNARSPPERRAAALGLVAHLTSLEANIDMAVQYARNPPRRAAYDDPRLKERAPFIASLVPILAHARPRPVTPYYGRLTDILQSEFSAAVAGVRSPAAALARAQALADHAIGARA